MKLYIVYNMLGGNAREDTATCDIVGAFTDPEVARKCAILSHGEYTEVEINYIYPGIKDAASEFGFTL